MSLSAIRLTESSETYGRPPLCTRVKRIWADNAPDDRKKDCIRRSVVMGEPYAPDASRGKPYAPGLPRPRRTDLHRFGFWRGPVPWPTHVRTDELVSALRLFEDGGDLAHPDKIRACLSGTSALPWDTAPDISGLCRLVGLPRAAQLEGAKAFMLATGLSARVVRRTVVSKPGMPATSCTLLFDSLEPGDLCRVAPGSGVLDARVAGERQRTAKWGAWKEGDGCPFKLLRLSALEADRFWCQPTTTSG